MMISDSCWPSASCEDQPKVFSASEFQFVTRPSAFMVMTASRAVLMIKRSCSSLDSRTENRRSTTEVSTARPRTMNVTIVIPVIPSEETLTAWVSYGASPGNVKPGVSQAGVMHDRNRRSHQHGARYFGQPFPLHVIAETKRQPKSYKRD